MNRSRISYTGTGHWLLIHWRKSVVLSDSKVFHVASVSSDTFWIDISSGAFGLLDVSPSDLFLHEWALVLYLSNQVL